MDRVRAALVSLRTTAALLVALSGLLVLNVILPQRAVDPASYASAVRGSALGKLFLETLGFGHVATSPAFAGVIAALFANLGAVLIARFSSTLKRVRFAPPAEPQVRTLLEGAGTIEAPCAGIEPAAAAAVLEGLGYRTARVGGGVVWGVKHRLAPLGFLLFHASFFLVFAGGLSLYLTRHVVTLAVTEGMETDSSAGAVVRRAPLGAPPPVRIALERVDVALEKGAPVDLAATLGLDGAPSGLARINAPSKRGSSTILVERAGIAPVLWLVDGRGYTLDRVLVPVTTPPGFSTRLEMASGDVEAAILPIPLGPDFPERSNLATVSIGLRVRRGGETVFDGAVRPGDVVPVGEGSLRVSEVRYWAGFRIVSERGGALLVSGFVLVIAGIVLRMVLFRREMVVAVGGGVVRVAGRAEFVPGRVRDEIALARDLMVGRGRSTEGVA